MAPNIRQTSRSLWLPSFLAAVLALLFPTATPAPACIMRYDVASSAYEQFSEPYHGQALWLRFTNPGATTPSYCSAFRLNDMWAITAAHCMHDNMVPVSNVSVGTSANYKTPDLGEVRQIVRIVMHPAYNGTLALTSSSAADVALLQFDRPLSGPSVRLSPLNYPELIRGVGYGKPGTPVAGELPADGKRRAYQMRSFSPSASYPHYYQFGFQPGYSGTYPLEGAPWHNDSGSGMLNAAGDLVAIVIAVAPGDIPGPIMIAYGLRIHLFKDWIESVTLPPLTLPQLTLTPLPAAGVCKLTWDASATGWTLQSSPDLATWTPLLPALTGPGTRDDPAASRRFYRFVRP